MIFLFFQKKRNYSKKRVSKVPRKNQKNHVQKKFGQTRLGILKSEKSLKEIYRRLRENKRKKYDDIIIGNNYNILMLSL